MKCIKNLGIHNNRSLYLKTMASALCNEHDGRVPVDLHSLMNLDGVGRKTAVLVMNEVFDLVEGIGTDVHVLKMSSALGFINSPKCVKLTREHVETSLITWNTDIVSQKMFNPIVGSFAQIFTQQLRTIGGDEIGCARGKLVMLSCADHIQRPYHVELLWFAIVKARIHYRQK